MQTGREGSYNWELSKVSADAERIEGHLFTNLKTFVDNDGKPNALRRSAAACSLLHMISCTLLRGLNPSSFRHCSTLSCITHSHQVQNCLIFLLVSHRGGAPRGMERAKDCPRCVT